MSLSTFGFGPEKVRLTSIPKPSRMAFTSNLLLCSKLIDVIRYIILLTNATWFTLMFRIEEFSLSYFVFCVDMSHIHSRLLKRQF